MSYDVAREHFSRGHFQTAADLLEAWLRGQPADAEARFLLAHCWLRMEHPERAREELEQAARAAPERAEIWHDLGCCYHDLGRAEEAARAFERAASLGRPEGMSLFQVRDLILLLDVSQQAAQPWVSMRQWVHDALRDLRKEERFALVGFNQDLQGYQQGTFCSAAEVNNALRWLTTVTPAGKADMSVLLERLVCMVPERGRKLLVQALVAGPVAVDVPTFENVTFPFVLEVQVFSGEMGPALERVVQLSRRSGSRGLG